jgi:hypothetical protein
LGSRPAAPRAGFFASMFPTTGKEFKGMEIAYKRIQ